MNELFRMNEYGDIWQEPTLFDQAESGVSYAVQEIHCDGAPILAQRYASRAEAWHRADVKAHALH